MRLHILAFLLLAVSAFAQVGGSGGVHNSSGSGGGNGDVSAGGTNAFTGSNHFSAATTFSGLTYHNCLAMDANLKDTFLCRNGLVGNFAIGSTQGARDGTLTGGVAAFKSYGGIRFADQFSTIQAAINDAGVGGTVFIPANYSGSDSYNSSGTSVWDLRTGSNSWLVTDSVNFTPFGGGARSSRVDSYVYLKTQPNSVGLNQAWANIAGDEIDFFPVSGGFNFGPWNKTFWHPLRINFQTWTPGQNIAYRNEQYCFSEGDCIGFLVNVTGRSGHPESGGEGIKAGDFNAWQLNCEYTGSISSGGGVGATSLGVNGSACDGKVGEGSYLLDSASATNVTITAITWQQAGSTPTSMTVASNTAWSGASTTTTLGTNVTNLYANTTVTPGSMTGITTGTYLCIFDQDAVRECGYPSATTATTFSFFFRKPHRSVATVAFGGGVGTFIDITVDDATNAKWGTINTLHFVFPVAYSTSTTAFYVFATANGAYAQYGSGWANSAGRNAGVIYSGAEITGVTLNGNYQRVTSLTLEANPFTWANSDAVFSPHDPSSGDVSGIEVGATRYFPQNYYTGSSGLNVGVSGANSRAWGIYVRNGSPSSIYNIAGGTGYLSPPISAFAVEGYFQYGTKVYSTPDVWTSFDHCPYSDCNRSNTLFQLPNSASGNDTISYNGGIGNFSGQQLLIKIGQGTGTEADYVFTRSDLSGAFSTNPLTLGKNQGWNATYLAEVAAPSGKASNSILWADSSAHRLKMSNNNGTADTVLGAATTDTLTNKTFDTAGTGNSFSINSNAITGVTGTGANVVLATSPTITTPTFSGAIGGTFNASAATHTLPALTGVSASKPATCTVGEMYFATDVTAGQNWFFCTATNTWTQQINSGGGSAFANGLGTGYQDVTETAAPANPGAGNERVYTDSTTHRLSCLRSDGTSCNPIASSASLDSVTAAGGATTISSGDNAIKWRWTLTTASKNAFEISEASAATNGAGSQYLFYVDTLAASTAKPFGLFARGTSNGIEMSNVGVVSKVGSGSIVADALSGVAASALSNGTTGSGSVVLGTSPTIASPTFTAPVLGVATGTSLNLGATGTLSTTAQSGTGSLCMTTSCVMVTPTLGVASATTLNKYTFTAPATGATLTILDGKTLTVNNTMTFAGGDSSVITFPNATATALTTNAAVTVPQGGTGITAGTSGGVPYFSASTTLASSAALTAHGVVVGGGAATAPTSTSAGSSGQCLLSNGAAADPTFQACPGGSSGSWSALTNPTADLSLALGAFKTTMTSNSGASVGTQYLFTDTWNNAAYNGPWMKYNFQVPSAAPTAQMFAWQANNSDKFACDWSGRCLAATSFTAGTTGPGLVNLPATAGGGKVALQGPANSAANTVYIFPNADAAGQFKSDGAGNLSIIPATVTNVTAATATNPSAEANLMALTIPAGAWNVVGRYIHVKAYGLFTTAASQVPTLRLRAKLCSVSGCGSGTVVVLGDWTTGNTVGSTTNQHWNIDALLDTAVAGASGQVELHGALQLPLSATVGSAGVPPTASNTYQDFNTGPNATTINLGSGTFLQLTVLMSSANAGNSVKQVQFMAVPVN